MPAAIRVSLAVCLVAVVSGCNGCDTIDLENNAGGDEAVILVDGSTSGACVDDQVFRTVDQVGIGSYDAPGACNSDVIVFSDGDAVALFSPVTAFSPQSGTLVADLTPDLIAAAVSVWQAPLNAVQAGQINVRSAVETALAGSLFDSNHAGIAFTDVFQGGLNAAQINTINNTGTTVWNTGSCASVANVTGNAAIFNAGQLNVYYTGGGFTGWYCPGSSVIMVGMNAQPETLTHEYGHAFSLGHTNNVDYDGNGVNDFPNTNIMWGGGVGRDTYSEGQDFRMSLNPGSELNTLGFRAGATRNCPDATISAQCPWLGLDVTPN